MISLERMFQSIQTYNQKIPKVSKHITKNPYLHKCFWKFEFYKLYQVV